MWLRVEHKRRIFHGVALASGTGKGGLRWLPMLTKVEGLSSDPKTWGKWPVWRLHGNSVLGTWRRQVLGIQTLPPK